MISAEWAAGIEAIAYTIMFAGLLGTCGILIYVIGFVVKIIMDWRKDNER